MVNGKLAHAFGGVFLPLCVMRSAGGFYLGTRDPQDGSPFSRESVEYWTEEKTAQAALFSGAWTQRDHP